MIIVPEIEEITKGYNSLEMSAYRLIANLQTGYFAYDNLHLDGILSYCVVQEATQGKGLPMSAEGYKIDLPLKKQWINGNGFPLWCSNDFSPCYENSTYSTAWTKRAIRPELLKRGKGYKNIRTTQGANKEMLISCDTNTTLEWYADFYGNAIEVARLLSFAGSIGKKRAIGYGVINSWKIQSIDNFSFFNEEKTALRNIPIASLPKFPLNLNLAPIAWTPPYWQSNLRLACIPFGDKYD